MHPSFEWVRLRDIHREFSAPGFSSQEYPSLDGKSFSLSSSKGISMTDSHSTREKNDLACSSTQEYHSEFYCGRKVRWFVVVARVSYHSAHQRRNLHRAFEDDVDVWMVIGRPNVINLLISAYRESAIHTIFKILTRKSLYNTLLRIGSPVFSGFSIHARQSPIRLASSDPEESEKRFIHHDPTNLFNRIACCHLRHYFGFAAATQI